MVAYRTGSNPIEIGDLGSKVKVTVTENVCKNDEKLWKKFAKNTNLDIFEIRSRHSIGNFIAVILIPNMTISCKKQGHKSINKVIQINCHWEKKIALSGMRTSGYCGHNAKS